MIVTTRVAMLVAFTALGLSGCQPHRAPAPASDSSAAAIAPQTAAPEEATAATTTRPDDSASSHAGPAATGVVLTSPNGRPATGRPCRVHLRRDAMGLATV